MPSSWTQVERVPITALREVLGELLQDYVFDLHGEDTCDCDASVGMNNCTVCRAKFVLEATLRHEHEEWQKQNGR